VSKFKHSFASIAQMLYSCSTVLEELRLKLYSVITERVDVGWITWLLPCDRLLSAVTRADTSTMLYPQWLT